MPKPKTQPVTVIDTDGSAMLVTEATQSIAEGQLALAQQASHVRAVALQIGYLLPADATHPDLIQRDIAANMRRSVEACLEVGRGLTVLKSACAHGEFSSRLDVLNMDVDVAGRFMRAAQKFSKSPSTATLKAINSQAKLFEMLVLDDDQITELELVGSTGELSLDDVATMSVKELRRALRDMRQQKEADDSVFADQASELTKLKRGKSRVADHDWQANFAPLRDQIHIATRELDNQIGVVDLAMDQALASPYDGPDADSADEILQRARGEVADQVRSFIARQRRVIAALDKKFEQTLGMFATNDAGQGHAE